MPGANANRELPPGSSVPEGTAALLALGAETLTVCTADGGTPPSGEDGALDGSASQADESTVEGGD